MTTVAQPATLIELRESDHSYKINGRPAPHVTSVIKESGLADWRWVKEYFRDRGSRAHKATHFMIEKDLDLGTCPEDVVGYVISAANFLTAHNAETVAVERRVASLNHFYAGTLDWLGYLDACQSKACCPRPFTHALTMQDWKTSLVLHPATAIQTIAYADAWYEMTLAETGKGQLPHRRTCVLLAEDGGPARHKEYPAAESREDRETWRAALKCCGWRKRHGQRSPYDEDTDIGAA